MRLRKRWFVLPGEALEDLSDSGLSEFLDLVGDTDAGLAELQDASEVNGRGNQHQVARSSVDRLFQFMPLDRAVAHGGKQIVQMRETIVGSTDGTDCVDTRVNQFCCFTLTCGYHAGTVGHFSVSKGGPVFHDQH